MNKKLFKILEIVGIGVIYLIATILHFVYDWTNGSVLSILFGAVNESVWEHVKIFIAGYVVWAMVELLWVKPPFKRFIVAKVTSLCFLSAGIIIFFYAYTYFTGEAILFVDLASSVAFVALSQYLSYRLTTGSSDIESYFPISIMMLMLFFVMFFSFTIFPPKLGLFRDPITGMYSIVEDYIDVGAFYLDKI